MATGIYVGMSGARVQEHSLETIANNLANARTPGFKRQDAIYRAIRASVAPLGDPRQAKDVHRPVRFLPEDRIPAVLDERYTRWEQGPLRRTDDPLDLALEGEGLFTIAGPDGQPLYTRDGAFSQARDGTLVTQTGEAVLDPSGQPIRIPSSAAKVTVTSDGRVEADGAEVGRLAVVRFTDPRALDRAGDSNWRQVNPQAGPQPATAQVHQGWLEGANVNPVQAMTQLIKTQRVFGLNLKAIEAYQNMDREAIHEVGRRG
jgi:flagellar basal-body rod protein FlgG